jgi:hypothetical protein
MTTLSYAIRGTDGVVVRGEAADDTGNIVSLGQAKDVSLNLTPDDIAGYLRQGDDLVIHLATGEAITLENYFLTVDGEDRALFISKNGAFQQVTLGEPVVDQYFVQYEPLSTIEKWSAYEQLTFLDLERVEPVVAPLVAPVAGLAPGLLGLGGAAVAASAISNGDDDGGNGSTDGGDGGNGDGGTGGDDGGNSDGGNGGGGIIVPPVGGSTGSNTIIPTVDDPDVARIVGGREDSSVTISGTGESGSRVNVTIGPETQTTTIGDDGRFSVTFPPAALPDDGVYNATVVVDAPDATVYNLAGPSVDIDTTPPEVTVTQGTASTGDLVNEADHSDGVVISGTGEAGAALSVEINGTPQSTTVLADGTWSVTFASDEIDTGEYSTGVTITSTDARGNVTTLSDSLNVDTVAPSSALNTVEGDNIINAAEASDGVVLSGTGEAGSTLSITFEGVTQTVTVDGSGNWSSSFDASTIAAGTRSSTISITGTDLAGNSQTERFDVQIDTEGLATLTTPIAGDNIINAAEAASGLTLTGTAEAGATVQVTFEGVTRTVTADDSGDWSASYTSAEIPTGPYDSSVTVSATDIAGNTVTTSENIRVDTDISVGLDDNLVGGDDTANASEVLAGFALTGTAEAGSSVEVQLGTATRTVIADSSGNWSANFNAADVTPGEFDAPVTVTATDFAGNSTTTTSTLRIDTTTSVNVDLSSGVFATPVNAAQMLGGVVLEGTTEPNASVLVEVEGVFRQATADESGNWSVTYESGSLPMGTYTATAKLSVTDVAGNTATASANFLVDTDITTPIVDSVTFAGNDVTALVVDTDSQTYDVHALNADGTSTDLPATEFAKSNNRTEFEFDTPVQDGTHLVVEAADAAGNRSDTLIVLDDNADTSSTLGHAQIGSFNIEGIDLDYAAGVTLTLTEAQIKALSDTSDTLTIHGGDADPADNDQVTIQGAVKTDQTETIDGQTYDVYTVGDDGVTLVIDQDINVIV